FAYECVRFGCKQAWACRFGGTLVALIVASNSPSPREAVFARYDALFLAALALQAALLASGLETRGGEGDPRLSRVRLDRREPRHLTRTSIYPHQAHAGSLVRLAKLGSWSCC
ncbi:MAG TPA: DUF817 family protein, partial [Dokdonella sp.]